MFRRRSRGKTDRSYLRQGGVDESPLVEEEDMRRKIIGKTSLEKGKSCLEEELN